MHFDFQAGTPDLHGRGASRGAFPDRSLPLYAPFPAQAGVSRTSRRIGAPGGNPGSDPPTVVPPLESQNASIRPYPNRGCDWLPGYTTGLAAEVDGPYDYARIWQLISCGRYSRWG
jgi:hypothetical protein